MATKSNKSKSGKSMFNAPVYGKMLYDPRKSKSNKSGKKK